MNFNQLKSIARQSLIVGAAVLFFSSCNDDKSANNSTGSSTETDTTAKAPVVKKKSGKARANGMAADDASMKMEKDKMGYYNRVETVPAFAGGQSSLEDYITNNIQYPQDAIDNNVEGVVQVQFGVDEKGNISNVTTVGNKLGHGLEEEAIRVVSSMPKWTPGQVKGKNVKTWRTLPINYKLEEI